MIGHIKESDWKIFKKIRPLALERYCEKLFGDIDTIINKESGNAHERYLKMYKSVDAGDEKLAIMFDAFSRSKALFQLALYVEDKLVKEEEFEQFSEETKEKIHAFLEFRNG